MSENSPNPYAAPKAIPASLFGGEAQQVIARREFRYPSGLLAKILKGLLLTNAMMSVLTIGSDVAQLLLLSQPAISEVEANQNDLRAAIIGLLSLLLMLITVVVFCTWIIRAHHNVRWFGASNLSITPGWAVGYFFIPILNLFRPYSAMSELYKASKKPLEWRKRDSGGLVIAWWTFWLISGFMGQLVFRASMESSNSISALKSVTNLEIVSECVSFAAALLAYKVVSVIQKDQEKWVNETPT